MCSTAKNQKMLSQNTMLLLISTFNLIEPVSANKKDSLLVRNRLDNFVGFYLKMSEEAQFLLWLNTNQANVGDLKHL